MRICCVLHHHAVSLKISGLLETLWSVGSTQCVSVCACERFCAVRIHSQLVKVYGTHVRSQKQVWMWCSAFSHGRTRGQHVTIQIPKQMTMCFMQMPVIREDRCIKLTNVAHDLDISLCSVHCSPPSWTAEKCVHCGWQRISQMIQKLYFNWYVDQGEQFCSELSSVAGHMLMSSRLDSYIHCHRWHCVSCRCSFQRGQTR